MTTVINGSYPSVNSDTDATINGLTVGKGNYAATQSTALGTTALASANSSSDFNTAVGYQSAYSTTSGQGNTALGRKALYSNTTANDNTAVGNQALYTNSTGTANVAVGQNALVSNTTASNNTAVGYGGLQYNITGTGNSVLGYRAGWGITSNYNTAIGVDSMSAISGGVGQVSGANNTCLGYQTFYNLSSGSNNTAVGYQAGYSNLTATYLTVSGYQAGYSCVGNGLTAYGYQAGQNVTSGTYNTFIGVQSGQLVTTGGSNTIIGNYNGNQGGLDIRTASNYIVLSDGAGNPRAYWNGSGTMWSNANTNSDVALYLQNAGNSTPYGMYLSFLGAAPNNTTQYFFTGADTSLERIKIYSNGNIVNRNNSYGALSDAKLKENIVDTTPKLDKLMQVKVRNFNMIGDDLKQIGFVAQELETVFPSLVIDTPDTETTEDGVKELGTTTKEVKTTVLIPILVKAIQELKAEVDALKAAK